MRVAALYDIHGNLPALEAVLGDLRNADVNLIVIGGDVFPGPMASEALASLLDLDIPVQFIRGNGDREVLALKAGTETGAVPERFRDAMRWNAEQLKPEHERLMANWPPTFSVEIEGLGTVCFCHASPRDDTEIFTRLTPEDHLRPVFAGLDVPVIVCGHTHMQFDRTVGDVRVVNAGSVGMPFGEPGAYWLMLGADILLRHTGYDLANAAERIRASDYPGADEFALHNVLTPPSAEAALDAFARSSLG